MPKSTNHKDLYDRTYENGRELAIVKTEIRDIKDDIRDIKDNHLYTINKKIDRMTWWLILLLGGIVSSLVLQLLGT